ncbi:MAG: glycosyltransferase [Cyanobacteria bacterium SIG31]|nr:glycosyltransferase [Cyanobacteria bacterium SIG31]
MGDLSQYKQDLSCELEKYSIKEAPLTPKVSIIVPVYNAEKYLDKCVMSLIKQTLKDIEIILVNDGSKDSSATLIEWFQKYDARIKLINQENKKQGGARNNGLRNASGEYISFVDSDDWIDPDFIEKLYNTAIKYNTDITATNIIKHKKNKRKYNVRYRRTKTATNMSSKIKLCSDKKKRFFYVMNKLYKKSFLVENHITFEENCYFEDVLFSIKAIFHAKNIASEPNTNYHYIYNINSTINSKRTEKKKADHNKAYIELQDFAHKNKIKLPECLNYVIKYWKTPLFKIYKGEYKEKICLFGIIPIFYKQK